MSHSDDSWEDDLPDGAGEGEIVPSPPAPVVKRTDEEQRIAKLRGIEDNLLKEALTIMEDVHAFREIEPGQKEPPGEWIQRLGYDEAEKRLRVANASWLSAKEAPVGIAVAQRVAIGIIKARSSEKAQSRSLNIAVVQMGVTIKADKEMEIE